MLTLGINQDLYDCGVTLTDGRSILYAANEERFSRSKNQGGFPRASLKAMFGQTGVAPSEIGCVCVAGETTPPLPMRLFPRLQDWVGRVRRESPESFIAHLMETLAEHTPYLHGSEGKRSPWLNGRLRGPALRRCLPPSLGDIPVTFVEHHTAHAASAWALSGFEEALVLTADGMGDGLSFTVSRCSPLGQERLWAASSRDSFGLFFEMLTAAMGFTAGRDEGKLTGLAAAGEPGKVPEAPWFSLADGTLSYSGPRGRHGRALVRKELLACCGRENVAAWAQRQLEEQVSGIARYWLEKTGLARLAVAGGVFANVGLNRVLHSLEEVDTFFVCPNMGDGGLSLGAVAAAGKMEPGRLPHAFCGDSFGDEDAALALGAETLPYRRCADIEEETARLLSEGKTVARFSGPMEWGPRALGNRSILAPASDPAVSGRLNAMLKRDDFMPFAPAALAEEAERCVSGLEGARHAAEFMTLCFECTDMMKRDYPATVHVDGTARLQVVDKERNPGLHGVLEHYRRMTGRGVVLNTSFNVHEEPIVRTPGEAIAAFGKAGLDAMAMGSFLVERTGVEGG